MSTPKAVARANETSVATVSHHAQTLIAQALAARVLIFGTFTLKSGRTSPYFFNAGLLHQGSHLTTLAETYSAAINASTVGPFDVLFGPAYKGIPLAAITAVELYRSHGRDVGYAFNRKEAKDHGEGGSLVGAPLKGQRVLVLDDVITAGTAIREAVAIIQAAGGTLVGIVESLDRQERGRESSGSAVQEIEREFGVPVVAVMTMRDIIAYLQARGGMDNELKAMEACKAETFNRTRILSSILTFLFTPYKTALNTGWHDVVSLAASGTCLFVQ